MQKKLILPLILSTTLLTPTVDMARPNFLIAEQSTENIDCVEIKSYRSKLNEQREVVEETLAKKIEEIEVIEEVEEVIEVEETYEEHYPTYNPYNILEPSNVTREEMYYILEGTALQSLSNGYVYMEEVYGINSLFLVSLSAEESGWGRSSLAISNNNIGGIKSADGGWAYFSDWFECLSYKSDLLYNYYLSEDGTYFNGYSIYNINERYCEPNSRGTYGWSENINDIAYGLLNKLY